VDLTGSLAPDDLARATVLYPHGARKTVGSFWSSQACLLLFLRHAACPSCGAQVDELAPHLPVLKQKGVRVVLVGLADPSRLLSFRERIRLEDAEVDLVTDPSLACHRAAGLVSGAWATIRPASIGAALSLYRTGEIYKREAGDGDVQQQGGAMLLEKDGRVLVHHVARHLGDRVDMPRVVSLCALRDPVARF